MFLKNSAPRYIKRDAKKIFRFYQQILKEEQQALNERFNGVYLFKNGRSYIELFGDKRDMEQTALSYTGILKDSYHKLQNYAEDLDFREYEEIEYDGDKSSKWGKDDWIVHIPAYPRKFRKVKIEINESSKYREVEYQYLV